MSKIGIHSIIGPRRNFGEYLKRIVNAGQKIPMIKCVDDFGPAQEAKDLDPDSLTVGRLNVGRDKLNNRVDLQASEPRGEYEGEEGAKRAAANYYDISKKYWDKNPQIDIWETFNEFSFHWGWQSMFYIAMMDLVEKDGYVLSHYGCSSGNPPGAEAARAMIPCLQEAKKRGHYLSLHEYGGVGTDIKTLKGTQPFHALRYRKLYETILIPNDADAPLLLTEIGQAGGFDFLGARTLVEDMRWYDSELARDDYVKGAAIFTLGRWYQSNFQAGLPALAEYIVSTLTTKPTPEKPDDEEDSVPIFGDPEDEKPNGGDTDDKPNGDDTDDKPNGDDTDDEPTTTTPQRGQPRDQYRRNYLLLPNEATTSEGNARLDAWCEAVVASGVLSRHRWTMGTSADDSGIGDLDRRFVYAVNPESWAEPLDEFFTTNYPEVNYHPIQASTPDELRKILVNLAFG